MVLIDDRQLFLQGKADNPKQRKYVIGITMLLSKVILYLSQKKRFQWIKNFNNEKSIKSKRFYRGKSKRIRKFKRQCNLMNDVTTIS